ncbi:MAG: DJ-1/PfpI family protein [Bacteroidota bacterium]|nr:DJ-1/PfpI family protein [Bacteroidota bacterium]
MIKKILGIAPREETDHSYSPSPVARLLAVDSHSDYDDPDYQAPAHNKKVLVICTEQDHMRMRNGKIFKTGNHPIELFVPLLHLRKAGIDFEIATPHGKPVALEMWALPKKDPKVMDLYHHLQTSLRTPYDLSEMIRNGKHHEEDYDGIFIPGGHGAMLGLPEDPNVASILNWALSRDKHIMAICHGPAAFLALGEGQKSEEFPFWGYEMAVFPDSLDKTTPLFGYLPGKMPWFFGKRLTDLGVQIVNKKANGTFCVDRKLITGDSPKAANSFGRIVVRELLRS